MFRGVGWPEHAAHHVRRECPASHAGRAGGCLAFAMVKPCRPSLLCLMFALQNKLWAFRCNRIRHGSTCIPVSPAQDWKP